MKLAAKHKNIDHVLIPIDSNTINSLDYINYENNSYGEVTPHANRYLDICILERANKDEVRVLFDGFDGDSVLSYGHEYFFELAKRMKLIKLLKETKLSQ